MFTLNGQRIPYAKAWTHPETGVQYPANWMQQTSLEEKEAVGLVEQPDAVEPTWDEKFYWGVDQPKDHAMLQKLWISNVRANASALLSSTDWYIVRRAETRKSVPQEILDRRAEIRQYSNEKETAILATADTAALAAYVTSSSYAEWESQPDIIEDVVSFETTEDMVSSAGTI